MKHKVQQWIDNGKDYEQGIALLPRTGIYENLSRVFSLQGYTKSNAQTLEYYLCKLAGIRVQPTKAKKQAVAPKTSTESTKQIAQIIATYTPGTVEAIIKQKIREEFPFLNNKTCPDELKILVADRITAYNSYVQGHKDLFNCTPEKQYETAKSIIDNYQENKLIWEELNHYKKHHKLLKKHPIFKRLTRQMQLEKMTAIDMVKELSAAKERIWRKGDNIKKNPEDPKVEKWRSEIKEAEREVRFIETLMAKR